MWDRKTTRQHLLRGRLVASLKYQFLVTFKTRKSQILKLDKVVSWKGCVNLKHINLNCIYITQLEIEWCGNTVTVL